MEEVFEIVQDLHEDPLPPPVVLGGCAGAERPAGLLTLLVPSLPRPVTMGGCGGPESCLVMVKENAFCVFGLPLPGFLGVDFL